MAAAFMQGISPYENIVAPQTATFTDFKNCTTGAPFAPYTVNNSTGAGTFNMLSGAAYSINTYFMALEQKTTQCAAANVATSLGVTRGNGSPVQANPSFTLGTDEVTPLAMASAYSTFANHGVRCDPVAILQVTDRDGTNLPVPKTACNRVLDRQVADSVTSVLSQVIDGPLPGRTGRGDVARSRRRRKDRHHQRLRRRVVRRLHAGPCRRCRDVRPPRGVRAPDAEHHHRR